MSIIDILIVLACLAVGYWIVHSIVGSDSWNGTAGKTKASKPPALTVSPMHDWYIVLDIPRDSSHRDIQAAMKRQLAKAEANGDTAAAERIRRAAEFGLREARR